MFHYPFLEVLKIPGRQPPYGRNSLTGRSADWNTSAVGTGSVAISTDSHLASDGSPVLPNMEVKWLLLFLLGVARAGEVNGRRTRKISSQITGLNNANRKDYFNSLDPDNELLTENRGFLENEREPKSERSGTMLLDTETNELSEDESNVPPLYGSGNFPAKKGTEKYSSLSGKTKNSSDKSNTSSQKTKQTSEKSKDFPEKSKKSEKSKSSSEKFKDFHETSKKTADKSKNSNEKSKNKKSKPSKTWKGKYTTTTEPTTTCPPDSTFAGCKAPVRPIG